MAHAVQQVFTRWDGKGVPGGVGGEDIALSMRLFHLADIVEVHHRTGGADAAVEVARARRGTQFDPSVVDAFCAVAGEVLGDPADEPDWHALIAAEPDRCSAASTDAELDSALEAIADFTDLRSPCRAGHSRAVADLAAARPRTAPACPPLTSTAVRRAGLRARHRHARRPGHDPRQARPAVRRGDASGCACTPTTPSACWPGPTRSPGSARSRRSPTSGCDGSGYHRGLDRRRRSRRPARILAAACAFQAMTEPRPYRPALTAKQAAGELRADVRAGRLDADAVDAVLAAAGQPRGKRRTGPAGLTPREIEVLALIARGASTRQVAQRLSITPKTAETHIERIYAKTGASTRSTATLFAHAARPARHARTARSVGRTPDDRRPPDPYRRTRSALRTTAAPDGRSTPWPARQSSA